MFIKAAVRLVPLTVVLALALAPTAEGRALSIGFDNLPPGTQIGDQYASSFQTATSVRFGVDPDGSLAERPVAQANANAPSQPNVAYLAGTGGDACGDIGRTLSGRFAYSRNELSVKANTLGGNVRLRGYDANGAQVAIAIAPAPGLSLAPLTITAAPTKPIVSFTVDPVSGNSCIPIRADDLTFDDLAGQPLPPPDFGLAREGGATDDVGLLRSGTVTVPINVNRVNAASGPIAFDVKGLPAGVTATVLPNPATGNQVQVRLKAGKNAALADSKQIVVTATPESPAAGGSPHELTFPLTVHGRYDMRVAGMEVTQGIQEQLTPCTSPSQCLMVPSLPFAPDDDVTRKVGYRGVRLAARKRTVVRVFTHMKTGTPIKDATVALRGTRDGKPLPGGPLVSSAQNVPKMKTQWVTWGERTATGVSFDFVLPPEWTNAGKIDLEAQVVAPFSFIGTGPAECEVPSCGKNNTLRTTGVPFTSTGFVTLGTARLWHEGEDVSAYACCNLKPNPRFDPEPAVAFTKTEALLPLQEGGLDYDRTFYYATINITGIKNAYSDKKERRSEALDRLEDYADDNPGCSWANFCADSVMGVYGPEINTGGTSRNKLAYFNTTPLLGPVSPIDVAGLRATDTGHARYANDDHVAVTAYSNVDTGIHELSHGLGRVHADTECGGDDDGQNGENLTIEGRGELDGVGLDTKTFTPVARTDLGSLTGSAPMVFDSMSYCKIKKDDKVVSTKWSTVIGWEKNFSLLRTIAKAEGRVGAIKSSAPAPRERGRAGAAQAANLLRVHALIDGAEARIQSVKPRRGRAEKSPLASPLVLLARNAAGQPLARVTMKVDKAVADDDGQLYFAAADVPSAGVKSLELYRDGVLVGTRKASAHAPRVKVLAPGRRARVGPKRQTVVRWRATDADRDKLLIKVDYSVNDGRSWEPVYIGDDTGRASLPSEAFAGSRRARIRIRANDGFNESSARSARFRAVSRKPSVAIAEPTAPARVRADQTVQLRAVAHDDRRATIRSRRRVSWFDGKRRIARGALTSATGLTPGRRRLRVVVRDGRGTVGRDSVVVRVRPVRPQLLGLRVPPRVSRRARSLRLRVRSTVPAALRVSGGGRRSRAVKVSRAARRVTVKVKPGRRDLRLRLTLKAGGRSRSVVVPVAR